MKVAVRFGLLMFCFFILSACAVRSSVEKVSIEDVKANLKYENIVFRNFTAGPEVPSPEIPLIECKNTAADYLAMKNVFKNIAKERDKTFDGPTLFVDVTLKDLRLVSSAARFWGGALAGRSHMIIVAKLTDSAGSIVAEKELIGAPNAMGSAYSFGNSDRSLPKNMGVLLGDYILANVSKKNAASN